MPACLSKFIDDTCYEVGHTWDPSCSRSALRVLINCIKYSLQLYIPLYTATALMNRRSKEYFLKKLFLEIGQSTAFLSCNGFFMVFFFCLSRKIIGGFYPWSAGFLPGALCSFCAILIERKSRRGALAVYMLNQAFETTFNILKHNGHARDVQYGEVYIFAISTAALMFMYRTNNMPEGFIKKIIQAADVRYVKDDLVAHKRRSDFQHMKLSSFVALEAFGIGYGLQTLYNLVIALTSVFKSPGKLFKAFLRKENFKMGAFCGGLVLYNALEQLLSKVNKTKAAGNAAVSGFVAGLSMIFLRSSYISSYTMSKALELFYMNGIEKGLFPYFKHFDTLLYTICTALMFHAAVLQPSYLRSTYWNFLLKLTGQKFELIDRTVFNTFGYDSSWKPVEVGKR